MGVKERKAREFKKREKNILDAAFDLLIKLEPMEMTMEMIAEKVEIGRGTIYKHFSSKDEIYANLILKRRKKFIKRLKKLFNDSDNKESKDLLEDLIDSYVEYSTKDIKAFIVHKKCLNHYLKSNINKDLIEAINIQEKEKIELVESIMKRVFKELSVDLSDIKYLIYASWGMLRGAMDFMIDGYLDNEIDKELFKKAIKQIFLQGFKKYL